ncbi:hypothetical protein JTB14_001172 [Gonioctena quinquepunctata]|nr:hypothetical protein JTB14_001172 [Gonioctena quinquepunctata]
MDLLSVPISNHKPTVSNAVRTTESVHQPMRTSRRRCAYCSSKKKDIRTNGQCNVCQVPLCLGKTKDKRKKPSGAKFREQKELRLQEREKIAGSLKHSLQNNQDSTETIDATDSQDSESVISVTVSGPSEISTEATTVTSGEINEKYDPKCLKRR